MLLGCDDFTFRKVNWPLPLRRGRGVGFRLTVKLPLGVTKPNCRRSLILLRKNPLKYATKLTTFSLLYFAFCFVIIIIMILLFLLYCLFCNCFLLLIIIIITIIVIIIIIIITTIIIINYIVEIRIVQTCLLLHRQKYKLKILKCHHKE